MRWDALIFVSCAAALCLPAAPPDPGIRYNRDIRPILSDNCFRCHGADKNARKAKLRLDDRDVALEKGAIVPGKSAQSELVKRINATNPDDLMPPAESNKKLTPEQKVMLRRWIDAGANYEPHWSFIPPVRPPLPATRRKTTNPIDAFIVSRLEEKRIKPSPEADRATLLRRWSLDLTGLPPTPGEVAAFEGDHAGDACERAVDRLLRSPHYGERMAVPWLDVARFADTVGYHGDQNVNVFPYRDYVIRSFNRNKPFDQFTIEQLAGDLLPNATPEQRIATGFNRLNMVTREGGAQPKEYLAKYGADRVRTVGMAWLGLTVGCAECHDHKFDPFTTRDFYQLKAFFADIRQWGVYSDYKYTPNPDLKGWDNEHPFPPEETVESPYLQERLRRLRGQVEELALATASQHRAEFAKWSERLPAVLAKTADGWAAAPPIVTITTNTSVVTNKVASPANSAAADPAVSLQTNVTIVTNLVAQPDGSMIFGSRPPGTVALKPVPGRLACLRLELLPDDAAKRSVFRGNRSSETIQLSATLRHNGAETKLPFYFADADVKEPRYANGFEIHGIKDGWRISREHAVQKITSVWLLDPPLEVSPGDTLVLAFKTNHLAHLRASTSPFASENPLKSWSVASLPAVHSPDHGAADGPDKSADSTAGDSPLRGGHSAPGSAALPVAWLLSAAPDAAAFDRYKAIHGEILDCRDGTSPSVVTVAWKPDTTRILPRGNWQSEDGEIVAPLPPHFLFHPGRENTNRMTRLDLARWLVAPENPLTARTVVNRLWKQFFGSGLANPVDDLGLQGEPPIYPELLDWLAVEFRESGWDVKHIVRLIVTSATYRQSSNLRADLRDTDPNNRLLASQNARRLDAEFVRDNALAIAGLLNLDIGGPSAHPYQPAGYYANLQFPDRDYHAEKDDRQYRRGLYAHWQRTFLQPMLANFDAPSREECTAIRTVSNTPQQALTLLNDPTFVEAARVWAARLLRMPLADDGQRLDAAFRQALGRPITSAERKSLAQFLAAQRRHLATDADEAAQIEKVGIAAAPKNLEAIDLGAWTSACRVILNLHETITVY